MGRGGFVYADVDRRGTVWKRRQRDLAFLARIIELRASGDLKALGVMLRDHRNGPEWKQVAISRAIRHVVMHGPMPSTSEEKK